MATAPKMSHGRVGAGARAGSRPRRRRAVRRRRSPEQAESEILAAAESFLREHPFRDLQVDQVMARTGLARPSFYQYFRDRNQLVIRLVERLGAELFPMSEPWFKGKGNPAADLRAAYEAIAVGYAKHGLVLRAVADAATQHPDVERAYRGFIDRFIHATVTRIRSDIRRGFVPGLEPIGVATALVWGSERYLSEKLGRLPQSDPMEVVEVLLTIWTRTLYGVLA
ncbi:MAG: hypothetical protein QOD06_15 [Candidatus Binatota bacterium]|jgi:AcrR family transcriptional regulator|nr:hypothetical protein [Candidatus Binatota bacterium]